MSTVQPLPINLIFLPPNKPLPTLDLDDPKTRAMIDSIDKVRLINAIDVRPVGEKFELVCGKRRLAIAKHLGWEMIECKIGDWPDNQVAWFSNAENIHRRQLSPAEEAIAIQGLMREYEIAFGPDPGKAAGGIARASKAKRALSGGKYLPKKDYDENTENDTDSCQKPASPAAGLAGFSPDSSAPPKSYSTRLAGATGQSRSVTIEKTKIAKKLTEQQLRALDISGCTQDTLLKIASVEPASHRDMVVNAVIAGMDIDEAITDLANDPDETNKAAAVIDERKLSDRDWLTIHCAKLRDQLEDPTDFDREALLYRKINEERVAFRARHRNDTMGARAVNNRTPFAALVNRVFFVEHPATCLLCHECLGKNRDKPACDCNGCGYVLSFNIPMTKSKPRRKLQPT